MLKNFIKVVAANFTVTKWLKYYCILRKYNLDQEIFFPDTFTWILSDLHIWMLIRQLFENLWLKNQQFNNVPDYTSCWICSIRFKHFCYRFTRWIVLYRDINSMFSWNTLAPNRLPYKGRAIKGIVGFVVCNSWDLEPLDLLIGLALGCSYRTNFTDQIVSVDRGRDC